MAPGIRVDLMIGERLIVEVDGREHHSDPVAFERDRVRDARLSALGYRVLRFSCNQVMFTRVPGHPPPCGSNCRMTRYRCDG